MTAIVLPGPPRVELPRIVLPSYEQLGERLRLPRWARPWKRTLDDAVDEAVTLEGGFPVISAFASDATHLTQSVTVGAGSNRLLVVMVAIEVASASVSSGTFNGSALTKLGAFGATSFARVECWYQIAPASVTANVDLTPVGGGGAHWAMAVYAFDGAHQTTPLRTAAGTGADTGTSSSATVSGFTAGDYGIDIQSIDSTGHSPTPGASQTADYATQNMGAGTNEWRGSDKTADGTLAWSWTTSGPNAHLATAVIPAAAAGGGSTPRVIVSREAQRRASRW